MDKISYLELLPQLFDIIITTPEIADEFGKATPMWLKVIAVTDHNRQHEFAKIVDPGEASAIALAHEVESDYLVTDDLQARKLAVKLGLIVIGTLGILLKAKQKGLVILLKPVLEQIGQTDFRITAKLIETVLRDAGE
ncbi:MAG: DUF3368 domain-containing protein [Sphingobacteriales bacterium]